PALRGVVVVGRGVDGGVLGDVLGRMNVHVVESELQHAHAHQPQFIPEPLDVGRDHAQILRDASQLSAVVLERFEEGGAGSADPFSGGGVGGGCGNFPGGGKAAEVVDADDIAYAHGGAIAIDPPAVAVAAHGVPIVDRIAPELAGGREVVGRGAGDGARAEVAIEFEE